MPPPHDGDAEAQHSALALFPYPARVARTTVGDKHTRSKAHGERGGAYNTGRARAALTRARSRNPALKPRKTYRPSNRRQRAKGDYIIAPPQASISAVPRQSRTKVENKHGANKQLRGAYKNPRC